MCPLRILNGYRLTFMCFFCDFTQSLNTNAGIAHRIFPHPYLLSIHNLLPFHLEAMSNLQWNGGTYRSLTWLSIYWTVLWAVLHSVSRHNQNQFLWDINLYSVHSTAWLSKWLSRSCADVLYVNRLMCVCVSLLQLLRIITDFHEI